MEPRYSLPIGTAAELPIPVEHPAPSPTTGQSLGHPGYCSSCKVFHGESPITAMFCAQRALGWERWDPQLANWASSSNQTTPANGELRKRGAIFRPFVSGRDSEDQPASFGSWIRGIVGILVLLRVSRGRCAMSGRTLPAQWQGVCLKD